MFTQLLSHRIKIQDNHRLFKLQINANIISTATTLYQTGKKSMLGSPTERHKPKVSWQSMQYIWKDSKLSLEFKIIVSQVDIKFNATN